MLIEYLTFNYIFAYVWIAIWLSYQLFIHACSEANFRKRYFFCKFFLYFHLPVWNVRTDLLLSSNACGSIDLWFGSLSSGWVCTLFGRKLFAFFAFRIELHVFFYSFLFLSCCVFLSQISPEILAFSAYLFSFHNILRVFLCFFKFLCFLEYWNICWLEYFLEILCMKILFCLCIELIFLGHLDCYICLCNFGIQLTAVIIRHCFWN
jgi:hypothetical protein